MKKAFVSLLLSAALCSTSIPVFSFSQDEAVFEDSEIEAFDPLEEESGETIPQETPEPDEEYVPDFQPEMPEEEIQGTEPAEIPEEEAGEEVLQEEVPETPPVTQQGGYEFESYLPVGTQNYVFR